jgi:hypothetical protein
VRRNEELIQIAKVVGGGEGKRSEEYSYFEELIRN